MKGKGKFKENFSSRLAKCLLLGVAALFLFAGTVVLPVADTQAAANKTTKIQLEGKSGRYLLDTGYNFWLREKDGRRSSGGLKFIRVPSGSRIKSGYYMFEDTGRLCRKKEFHKVNNTTIGSRKFNGTYYFGGQNGVLYCKAGWITINGQKYLLASDGRRYENCWKYNYYLQSNGTIARSKKLPDGSYVDSDGRKCTKEELELDGLKKQLRKTLSGYSGAWSVYVKDLKTGGVINLNDQEMYPASTIKAFVMASTYDQIKKGNIKYTSTVKQLLTDMITVSDNEACNQLIRYNSKSRNFIDGTKTINKYLKANQYTETGCHHSLHPASSSYVGDSKSNVSSAKDCGVLLERIYNGTCVSSRYSREMLNLLLRQTRRWKIPAGLPSGVKVANKTGETSSVQHDMAIVFGKKTDYVICVFSRTGSEGYAVPRIKSISSTVYKYLNK